MEKQNGKAEVKRRGERVRRKKMQVREKVAKSRNIAFSFPMFWGSGGSKSRLAKAAGAAPSVQMRDEKFHAAVARSRFGSQKHHRFGALLEVEMLKK